MRDGNSRLNGIEITGRLSGDLPRIAARLDQIASRAGPAAGELRALAAGLRREGRRRIRQRTAAGPRMDRAVALKSAGRSLREIGIILGISHETVRRDLAAWERVSVAAFLSQFRVTSGPECDTECDTDEEFR
jgi:hypothetical protein